MKLLRMSTMESGSIAAIMGDINAVPIAVKRALYPTRIRLQN